MSHVLISEVAQRAEDRVGSTLTKTTERHLLDDAGQPFELSQVVLGRALKFTSILDELIDGLRRAGLDIEERRAAG